MINYGTVKDLKPSQILDFLNKTVYQTGQQKFVMTFFAAVYEPQNGRIIYANAGHNFPWFLKKAKANSVKDLENIRNFKKVNYLVARGPRLGNLINSKFNDEEVNLDPGDFIVFFTDGLIECCNEKKQEYGKKDCQNLMVKNHNKSAAEIKEEIIHNAFNFYGKEPREDDITLVVLKRLEGKQAEQVH